MKILLIDVYNYNKGGAEKVCFNTGDLLKKHGHEIVYFTLKWNNNNNSPYSTYFPESKETRTGILRHVKNLINYFYHYEAARKIKQLIKAEQPDIAHIHLIWGQITPSILPILKANNIPIVFTVHDYRLVCPAYTFRDGKGHICEDCKGKFFYRCFTHTCTKNSKIMSAVMAMEMYFRNYFYYPLNYFDGLIYVSNFARNMHEKYMPLTKDIFNITLYNFSTQIIPYSKTVSKEKFFLFFGRLSYEKGIETLTNAFPRNSEYKLKIVGTGPLENKLKRDKDIGHLDNIEFLGYKQGNELANLVSEANFVIVPSEWYENNPMTIIEAYSVGTPVIGARIGGIPEIIIDGKTGFLFKSGDITSLKLVIEKANSLTHKEYSSMSQETINYAQEHFNPDNYYHKLIEFYNTINLSSK